MIEKDGIDLSQYTGDLASLWDYDGKTFGIPQDWDTIALVYNVKDVTDAGLSAADLADLDWNPQDGGSFGKLVARLTIDENGVRGDEPGFDKTKVATYGWGLETGGGVVGQGPWSWLALSNGFTYLDKNPFGTHYNLDDPKLAEALTWWQKQIDAGYVTPVEKAGNLGLQPMMEQNKAALVPDGSWRINTWSQSEAQEFAFAPLPKGPEGRKTIINGLAPLDHRGLEAPGRGLAVGQVPHLREVPDRDRRRGRRLPLDHRPVRGRGRSPQGRRSRRLRLPRHREGPGGPLLLPDHLQGG